MAREKPLTDTAAELAGHYESLSAVPGNTRIESLILAEGGVYRYESVDRVGDHPTPPGDISDLPPDTTVRRLSSSGMWSVVEDDKVEAVELVDTSTNLEAAFRHMSLAVVDGDLVVRDGPDGHGQKFVKTRGPAGATTQ